MEMHVHLLQLVYGRVIRCVGGAVIAVGKDIRELQRQTG